MFLSGSRTIALGLMLAASSAGLADPEMDPSATCSLDLAKKPELAQISDKLPLGDASNITFAMLANDSVPTPQEQREIAKWFEGREECKKLGESYRLTHYPPEINIQLDQTMSAINMIGVDLFKSKISYGEANKRISAQFTELMAKSTEIIRRLNQETQAQRDQSAVEHNQAEERRLQAANQERQAVAQAEEQRRQRLQMILNYTQANRYVLPPPPQLPPLQSRPSVTTNCTQNGNQTNCTSQ
jgi:hypothetical protein